MAGEHTNKLPKDIFFSFLGDIFIDFFCLRSIESSKAMKSKLQLISSSDSTVP